MRDGSGTVVSRKAIVVIIALTSFIFPVMMSAVNVALPSIGTEFAMEAVALGWVTTIFSLVSAVFQLPAGRLADIIGRKKIFVGGIIVQFAGTVLCATAVSPAWLITARGIQAFGGAMTFSTSMAILTSVFPAGERGRVIGLIMAVIYLGLSAGPFIGGVLTQHLGWRSIFYLGTLVSVVVLLLALWKMKGEWADARGEGYDVTGTVIFCLSLGALMYGFSVLPTIVGICLVPLGMLGLAAFYIWETRVSSPILNVSLFRGNAVFVFSNIATMINYGATSASALFLSLYLQYIKGMSPQTAGTVLMVQPIIQAFINPISGRMADRIDPRLVASAGLAINCIGLALLVFVGEGTAMWSILAILVILGLGLSFFAAPNTAAVMGSTEQRFLGVASATIGTMRSAGMMLSFGLAMILFSIYLGDAQITPEYYPAFLTSMKVGFGIFAALSFAGIFAQMAGKRIRQEQET
jgi:MFS family permease